MTEDEFGLKEKVSKLPTTPGVYQFFDTNGVIIYIGKAKNLKNRVSSYFVKTNQTSKTMVLVRKIRDLKYIVVNTEEDALLLENNLIKKYKPRYNILLKDDKTYPLDLYYQGSFSTSFYYPEICQKWIRIFWTLYLSKIC